MHHVHAHFLARPPNKHAENIGDLARLMILSLTNNAIAHLPRSIGCLEQLEELSLQ